MLQIWRLDLASGLLRCSDVACPIDFRTVQVAGVFVRSHSANALNRRDARIDPALSSDVERNLDLSAEELTHVTREVVDTAFGALHSCELAEEVYPQ